jgi:predicted DNA-binding ribbon-helix-helix protein
VRLEPVFWRALEHLSERAGVRLGEYIAHQADRCPGGNFSSFLRVHCMLNHEEKIAEAALEANYTSLMAVVRAAPVPGVILSRYRSIIGANAAFMEWLGPIDVAITGANLTTVIQVRTRHPLNDVWQKMLEGQKEEADARVLYVAPGRVNAAKANFVAVHADQGKEFYAIMWLSVANPKQPSVLRNAVNEPISAAQPLRKA